MLRRTLRGVALVAVLLGSLDRSAIAGEPAETKPKASTPVAAIMATPDKFEGIEVTVRGAVVKAKRAVFPNGRFYSTLRVGDPPIGVEGRERVAITVFSWEKPSVELGDQVEVVGVFHVWRYNLPQMIESRQITRVGP